LVSDFLGLQALASNKEILVNQRGFCVECYIFSSKQRLDHRALPTCLGRRHAGLAKQGLLLRRGHIGIFHAHAQGIERFQRIAHGFDPILGAQERQLKHATYLL
jgi:hypothetical protein